MRQTVLAVAVIALMLGCKKEKAAPAGAASSAPLPAEGAPPSTPPAGTAVARPATVTDTQAAAYEKYAAAVELFGKDVGGAGADCAKVAAVMGTHAAGIKAANDAAKFDDADDAAKAWITSTYSVRMATAMAAYAGLGAKCAADKAFVAAASSMNLGALAMGKGVEAVGKAMDDYGKAMDQAGKAIDQAGKATDEAGKAVDEAGKATDEATKK